MITVIFSICYGAQSLLCSFLQICVCGSGRCNLVRIFDTNDEAVQTPEVDIATVHDVECAGGLVSPSPLLLTLCSCWFPGLLPLSEKVSAPAY